MSDVPISMQNLGCVPSFDGNAVQVDFTNAAWLQYSITNSTITNLTFLQGSIELWISPDWNSGSGPGSFGRLIDVGAYSTNAPSSWWSLYFTPDGSSINFSSETNGVFTNYLSVPIAWSSNAWHFVALTYNHFRSQLYVDVQLATNGGGVFYEPSSAVISNGFFVGSDSTGTAQSRACIDDMATYSYAIDAYDVTNDYSAGLGLMDSGGFHPDDGGGGLMPPGGGGGTNYDGSSSYIAPDYGTNLWLQVAGLTNFSVNLLLSNTLSGIKYEIQGLTNLMETNWISEGFVYGSEITNYTQTSISAFNLTNNLFLRIRSWADDGSELPVWWQEEYFGTNGVDPYGDPEGDGWSNLQKFQNGMDPNVFYTPPAPQNVTVAYNLSNNIVTMNWLPSPGPVTNYTLTISGTVYNISANSNSFQAYYVDPDYDPYYGPAINGTVQIQANYSGGNSTVNGPLPLQQDTMNCYIVPGSQSSAYISTTGLPAETKIIRLTMVDEFAIAEFLDYSYNTNYDIPAAYFTNNLYLLPTNLTMQPVDGYGNSFYRWYASAVDSSNNAIAECQIGGQTEFFPEAQYGIVPPYFDGRVQLKQNLIFQFRAATATGPFQFAYGGDDGVAFITYPSNYVYSGFYQLDDPGGYTYTPDYTQGGLDAFWPFNNNIFFENFVFNSTNVSDPSGALVTGVEFIDSHQNFNNGLVLLSPAYYQLSSLPPIGTTVPAVLATNQTRWLDIFVPDYAQLDFSPIGVLTNGSGGYTLSTSANNYWGLPFVSVKLAYDSGGLVTNTLYPGYTVTPLISPVYPYPETAQPQFQTVEYDFWPTGANCLPGGSSFSPTNTGNFVITPVGNPMQISGYAKLLVTNSVHSGVYGYLAQYFDQAYPSSNGILSPYGAFFATQPGPSSLVTMPDIDTGERGTCTVYAVSLQLDANHDGIMDLSYGGADATSPTKPMQFWLNNNYDRLYYDSSDNTNYEDDVVPENVPAVSPFEPAVFTPDYDYVDENEARTIPTKRDLEDFARLWVCGVTSNLLASLPTNSTVMLSWGDVGSPNTNNPTIDLFQAADPDGGIGYLTNSAVAIEQTNALQSLYIKRIGPGQYVNLNAHQFTNSWAGNHFIWCGVAPGNGQLQMSIADGNGNVLAQTSVFIKIQDIKQMYERWTLGENLAIGPATTAKISADDLPDSNLPPFQFSSPGNNSTPYILYVHGWNMTPYDKDRFAETAFKRLYWQGYQGRFGAFRWPTGNNFDGSLLQLVTNPGEKDNYDSSEYQAWQSGQGLLNKLNDLNAEYPGHVYLLAHSMGNVVAGEALRLSQPNVVVNTYVASQAAVSAHTYDSSIPTYSFFYTADGIVLSAVAKTPNIYNNWFSGNSGSADSIVSFYNTNDFALQRSSWQLNQLIKPDQFVPENGSLFDYFYTGNTNDPAPWNHFRKENDGTSAFTTLDIVNVLTNRYEVMALAAQSYTTALGATPNVGNITKDVDLMTVWPPDPAANNYKAHYWHSAQFRGDYVQEQSYWHELLGSDAFNLR